MSKIDAYVPVFAEKLNKIKTVIKSELSKPKKDRSTKQLRKLLVEAKKLQKIVGDDKLNTKESCPHCGKGLI